MWPKVTTMADDKLAPNSIKAMIKRMSGNERISFRIGDDHLVIRIDYSFINNLKLLFNEKNTSKICKFLIALGLAKIDAKSIYDLTYKSCLKEQHIKDLELDDKYHRVISKHYIWADREINRVKNSTDLSEEQKAIKVSILLERKKKAMESLKILEPKRLDELLKSDLRMCDVCKKPLNGLEAKYNSENNKNYCKEHYIEKFAGAFEKQTGWFDMTCALCGGRIFDKKRMIQDPTSEKIMCIKCFKKGDKNEN